MRETRDLMATLCSWNRVRLAVPLAAWNETSSTLTTLGHALLWQHKDNSPEKHLHEDCQHMETGKGSHGADLSSQPKSTPIFHFQPDKAQCGFWPARQLALVITSHQEQKLPPHTTCSSALSCLSMLSC